MSRMKGQDARPVTMLEEIVVAGAMPQQRENQQEHAHRLSFADGSRGTDAVNEKQLAGISNAAHENQVHDERQTLRPRSAPPRPSRGGQASPRGRKALANKKSFRRIAAPASPTSNEEAFKFELDLDGETAPKKPFWRRWQFYRNSFVFVVSFAFITAGILLRIFNQYTAGATIPQPKNSWERFRAEVQNFELWRWFFFVGGIAPIWWVGDFVVRLLVFLVESAFLNTRNVMYFLVAVRKPVGNFIRAVLLIPLYVPLFAPKAAASATAGHVYTIVLKAIGCLILFTFANVLSTLLAKMMASHFHKATYFHKMQEAIRKEYYLSVLLAPRPGRATNIMAFNSDVDLAKLESNGSDTDGQLKKPASFSTQIYNSLVAPILPGGAGRASSEPLTAAALQPEASSSVAANQLASSPGPSVVPPAAYGGHLATRSMPEHVEGSSSNASMTQELLADTSAADYYGAGNAEGVAAARDRPRRKLTSSHCRDPSDINLETPEVAGADDLLRELPTFPNQSKRRSTASSPFRKVLERSNSSQSKEGGPGKWGNLGTKEKFDAGNLMAEVIENSAEPVDLKEGDRDGRNIAARLHAVEKHLRKNPLQGGTFYDKLQRSTSEKGFGEAIEKQAKRAAFYIYWNVKPRGARSYMLPEDFEELLPPKQSREAFDMLDLEKNDRVSPKELCAAVTEIYQERANLAVQLKDTKSVVGRLKSVIAVVLHILFIFFYLVIYNVDIQKVWLLFSSVVLAFAFIFGNSIRQLYEAVILLFVIHPFDVGDWLMIGPAQYQVEEINLAMTTLRDTNNVRQYFPNTNVANAAIINISRSDNKGDNFTLPLPTSMPTHILEEVAKRLDAFLRANKNEYTTSRECLYKDVQDVWPVRTIIYISWQYTHRGADNSRTMRARSGVIEVVHDALHELGVYTPANRDNSPSLHEAED